MQRKMIAGLALTVCLGMAAACGSNTGQNSAATSEAEPTTSSISHLADADFAFIKTDSMNTGYRYTGPGSISKEGDIYLYDRDKKSWEVLSFDNSLSGQFVYSDKTLYLPLSERDVIINEQGTTFFERDKINSLSNALATDQGMIGYTDSSDTDETGALTSFLLTKNKNQIDASYKAAGAEIYSAAGCGKETWGRVRGEQRTLSQVPTSTTETLLEGLKEPITFARIDDVAASKKSFTPEQNHRVAGQVACGGQKLYQLVNIYADDGHVQTKDSAQYEGAVLESEPVTASLLVFDTASGEFSEVPVPLPDTLKENSPVLETAYASGKLWQILLDGRVIAIDLTSGEISEVLKLETSQSLISEQENATIADGKLTYFNASDPAKPKLYIYDLATAQLESQEELPELTQQIGRDFSVGDIAAID